MSYAERQAQAGRGLKPICTEFEVRVEVVGGGTGGLYPLRGDYAEMFWLPIVGPSTLLLARHLIACGSGDYETADLAKAIGLGFQGGLNSPLNRAANRLITFRFAGWYGPSGLKVVSSVPPIPLHEERRLPSRLQARLASYRAKRGPE